MTAKGGRWLAATVGLVLTVAWLAFIGIYVDSDIGWDNVRGMLPHEMGAALAGVFTPLAFLWLAVLYWARGRDLADAAAAINRQLDLLTFPSEAAAGRAEAAGAVLKRQAEALRSASDQSSELLGGFAVRFQSEAAALTEVVQEARAQTDRLREGLAAEIASAREVAAKLDAERLHWNEIVRRHGDSVTSAAGAATEQIAREMERRTDEIDAAVTRALEQGTSMAAEIKMQEEQLGQAVDSAIDRFGQAMARLARELAAAGDRTAQRGGELVDTLQQQMQALGRTADDATTRLKSDIGASTEYLTNSLTRLSDDIEARLTAADKQTQQITAAVRAAGAAGAEFEQTLAERAAALAQTGQTARDEAASAGEALSRLADDTAAAMRRPLDQTLDHFRAFATETAATLQQSGQTARDEAASAGQALGRLAEDTAAAMRQPLDQTLAHFRAFAAETTATLQQSGQTARDEAGSAGQALGRLAEDTAAAMRQPLDQTLDHFRAFAAETTATLQQSGQTARDEAGSAGQALGRLAEDTAAAMRRPFDQALDHLRAVASESAANAKSLSDDLTRQAEAVRTQSALAQNEAAALGATLARQMQDMAAATVTLRSEGQATAASLRAELEAALAQFRRAGGELLADLAVGAQGEGEEMRRRLAAASADFASEAQRLLESVGSETDRIGLHWRDSAEEAQKLRRALAEQAAGVEQISTEAGERMEGVLRQAEAKLLDYKRTAEIMLEKIDGMIMAGRDQADRIGATASDGAGKIENAGRLFADQAARLAAVATGAFAAQQQARDAIGKLSDALGETTGVSAERIGELERIVGTLKGDLINAAEEASRNSRSIAETFRGDTERLVGMARRAAIQVAAVRGVVKDQLTELGQLSTQVGQLVDMIRDSLRGQSENFAAVAAGARADSAVIKGELESQIQVLTQLGDQVAERLDKIGGSLDGRTEKLVEATDYVVRRSNEIGATFGERAQFLTETVDRIGNQVADLAQRFDQQTQQLTRSTSAAETQVQNLKRVQENVTRDLFLRAAAVMVEELNSLAMDISKLLESDVPADVWKDYHKGDRSIFARRLFRAKDSYLVPAIDQRYKDDDRFRDMVERYLGRFEELLAQAQEADPESVLNAAFITADVGKLYLVLSRSIGRSAPH
jgi:DNA-binding ferritin-like protein